MSLEKSPALAKRKLLVGCGVFAVALLVTTGIFAKNDWFPKTDVFTGKRTGWFGKPLAKNAPSSSWNPVAAVMPTPTPQLSKELIWAGNRLLAVEDANANQAPPADIAVWRPSNGNWIIMGQGGAQDTTVQFGLGSLLDIPLIGDYEGDGKTDFSIYRPGSQSLFYVLPSSGGANWNFSWGINGDIPVAADFDGDGKTDYAVVRVNSSNNELIWYVYKSSDSTYTIISWGISGDIPSPADFDGDGKADHAVYRPSDQKYYSINTSDSNAQVINMGQTADKAVPSDFDGDGKADFAIYKSSTAYWYIRSSITGSTSSTQWGAANDIPVHNDYDLDGKTDIAIWHPLSSDSVWSIKKSSTGGTRTEYWGITGDIPVPAFYRR